MSEKKKEKKSKTKSTNKFESLEYGSILFGVGVLIALVAAFINMQQDYINTTIAVLGIIGIAVGVLNIKKDETVPFLVASLVFVSILSPFLGLITQHFISSQSLSQSIGLLFSFLVAIIAPAAIVVASKTIFLTAKDR